MSDLVRTQKPAPLALGPPPRGKARAHSRLVRVLRILLPLTMVAMVAALTALVIAHAIRRAAATRLDVGGPVRMVNPHFFGRDSQDRPYTLSARAASRDPLSFQRVLLDHPLVTLNTGGPHPASLAADKGVYQEDTRILVLTGDVRGVDAKQARFASDQAVVNTRTGSVTGPRAVAADPAHGAIQSRAFDVYDKGDRMVFKGGVHARLDAR